MSPTARWLTLTLVVALLLLVGAAQVEAQYVLVPDNCTPTVSYYQAPTVTYYQPPTVSYYASPTVAYYAPPQVSYYAAPSVSYYAAPAVSYYAPAATSYYAPVATTYRYGLFGRRQFTSYYYAPAYVYP